MTSAIHFNIYFVEPQAHYVEIDMIISNFTGKDFIDIKMPVWAPGSYLIREYSKNVERLHVQSLNQTNIPFEKTSKNTWRLYHKGKDVKVSYSVYAFETSVRTSFVDASRAFLSPVGVFMYIDGYLDLSSSVSVSLPSQWSTISTGLPLVDNNKYFAENFDILFDSPFEIGNQDTWTFDIEGVLHECAMVGEADYDKNQLTEDITTIVREENRIWGSNPNNYYLFVTHNYQQSSGGLEHLNSTVLAASRFAYKNSMNYKSYLSLVAHEYFHLWNVKRLRPKALGPFNYEEENYTTGLWIMEGFTAYYDNLIIRRCGFHSEQEYLQQLAVDFNTVYNRPGYTIQSAALASFDTWIKQYRPDENSQNVSISYYNKGAMLSAALDIKIIAETGGEMRLDDVLKTAYNKFYLTENRGFEEKELQELAENLTGLDLSDIFGAAHSNIELDYNHYFNKVGYELKDLIAEQKQVSLGIKIGSNDGKTVIKNIDRNSSAWISGLNVDDELIAIDNHRIEINGKAMDYILSNSQEGDTISVLISRDGLIKTITVVLLNSDKKSFAIQRNENASEAEKLLGAIWLSL